MGPEFRFGPVGVHLFAPGGPPWGLLQWDTRQNGEDLGEVPGFPGGSGTLELLGEVLGVGPGVAPGDAGGCLGLVVPVVGVQAGFEGVRGQELAGGAGRVLGV